ncbi:MAG: very short patch repair endonuclease [Bacteroidaceae bacterium]|nr:very short patch repair endonuclease [Bacteroidaceae bacterium]
MADKLTIEQRHYNMSRIRAKDTKPEIIVRKYLWSHGFRYRLNHPRLPGKPDIVLRKYRTCIFVNGCFWHGHFINDNDDDNDNFLSLKNSECCKIPHTNRAFWVRKIMRNKERDIDVKKKLSSMGWHSITIWECELKPNKKDATLESLAYTLSKIFLQNHKVRRYELPEEDNYAMVAEDTPEYNSTH